MGSQNITTILQKLFGFFKRFVLDTVNPTTRWALRTAFRAKKGKMSSDLKRGCKETLTNTIPLETGTRVGSIFVSNQPLCYKIR